MAALPDPLPHSVNAVYDVLAAEARGGDSTGIAVSDAIHSCDRYLFYKLHWAAEPRPTDGPGASRLKTGLYWEDRLIDDLARIGCIFDNHQLRVQLAGGWLRGRVDATATGFREAPVAEHLVECKSLKAEKFRAVVKHGVQKAIPEHYAQSQLYAHALGVNRIAYWCVNKDTDERHLERIHADPVYAMQIVSRIERIAALQEPPAKLHENPHAKMAWECGFCPALAICHDGAFARRNCRTCLRSTLTPEALTCERDGSVRKYEAQQAGCEHHRYMPGLVNAEQIDVRGDAIVYRLADGSEWIDGGAA